MPRQVIATINHAALRHNIQQVRKLIGPTRKIIAMVKSNAYGHGAIAVAKTLAPCVDSFGVACLEEGLQLREAGCIAEQEVDVGVAGEVLVTGVEGCRALRVGLKLLVFVIVEPIHAEFELVAALVPGEVVAVFESLVAVLPGVVRLGPRHAERRSLKIDCRHVVTGVVLNREKACGSPAGRDLE